MPRAAKRTPPHNRKPTIVSNARATEAQPRRWFDIQNIAEPGYAEIRLYGYIGAPRTYRDYWTGEEVENPDGAGTLNEFSDQLEALGAVEHLQISIFSNGGDWDVGVAIHNLLVRHPAHKICIIDGLCASAATYPAMACDEIRIPSNASMLIHEASGGVYGREADVRAYADNLAGISNNIAELYAARSGKAVAEIRKLMNEERYLFGQECIDLGIADTLIEPLTNLASRAGSLQPTNSAALRHAPAEVLALFDMRGFATASQNMKIRTPLMNAAADPAATAGAQAGGSPATAPAAPAATAPPPANAAPPAPVAAAPAAPAAAAPTNAAPSLADITSAINTAVTNAVAPLQQRLQVIEGQRAAGISPENLAGAPPAAGVAPVTESPKTLTKEEITNMSAAQLIAFGRNSAKPTLTAK